MPVSVTRSAWPGTMGDLRQASVLTRLTEQLRTDGVAVFTGIRGPEDLLAAAGQLMHIVAHPDSDEFGLTTITDLGPAFPDFIERPRLHQLATRQQIKRVPVTDICAKRRSVW